MEVLILYTQNKKFKKHYNLKFKIYLNLYKNLKKLFPLFDQMIKIEQT